MVQVNLPEIAPVAKIAPYLRGAVALSNDRDSGIAKRQILAFRTGDEIMKYVNGAELARYSQAGVATPDHTIRTKGWPLIAPSPADGKLDDFKCDVRAAVTDYVSRYRAYFERNNARYGNGKTMVDPLPRVVLVPGNHEYYRGSFDEDRAALLAANTPGVTVLDRGEASIAGSSSRLRVLGATLWTDYAVAGDREAGMAVAGRELLDHSLIRRAAGSRPFLPADALAEHRLSRGWLARRLAELQEAPTIVVTLARLESAPCNSPCADGGTFADAIDLSAGSATFSIAVSRITA